MNKYLFVNFSMNERTHKLSEYSIKKCGFTNYVDLDQKISFYQKMKIFFDLCYEHKNKYEYFIRSDADRIIMPGISRLINIFESYDKKPWFVQGTGIEYIMNLRERNATPNLYSRDCIIFMKENFNKIVPNDRKPETALSLYIKNNIDNSLFISNKTEITNLHEFEQHPKKIVSAFLNRLWRGHGSYYNQQYLNALPIEYRDAINIAVKIYEQKGKNNTFEYVSEKEMMQINKNFKLYYDEIKDVESVYEQYLKKYGAK